MSKNKTKNKCKDCSFLQQQKEWEQYQKELDIREFYNLTMYDKSILIWSSVFLVFSLTILKDVGSQHLYLIVISWICFTMVMIVSLVSFYVANKSISHCRDNSNEKKCNQWRKYNIWLNVALGVVFGFGIIFVILFTFLNL